MAVPKTAGEAIGTRLLTDPAVTGLIGNRVTPNKPEQLREQDVDADYLVVRRIVGGEGMNLSGRRRLQNYIFRLEAYAATDERAEKILAAALDRLCGNPTKAIAPWVDKDNGVHGCFPAGDADADVLDDGQTSGQSVSIWYIPPA